MNEELQSKLVEILGAMQDAAKTGGDFAMAQLPDIAQNYVIYGRISTTLSCVFYAVLAYCSWLLGQRLHKASDGAIWIAAGLFILFAAGSFVADANSALLVWFAPKVWLLKEIAGLLK